mgnify:CR=1 FL=1
MMYSEQSLPCSRCGERHNVVIHSGINVSENPELKAKVLDGSAFLWECPHCGQLNLIKGTPLYHDPEEKIMIWVTGGDYKIEEQVSASFDVSALPEGYTLRFVADTGSLIEKVKIFDDGLDDIAIELCKYVTRTEMIDRDKLRGEDAAAMMEAPFKYLKMDGADNEMVFSYPMKGQLEMVVIGLNVYQDALAIIGRNPVLRERAEGFVRIDSAWLAGILA